MTKKVTFEAAPNGAKRAIRCYDQNGLTAGELAERVVLSRMHVWRLAKAGKIPGARRTKGGHYRFPNIAALGIWIAQMNPGRKKRREILKAAYADGYGKPKAGTPRSTIWQHDFPRARPSASEKAWGCLERLKRLSRDIPDYQFELFKQELSDYVKLLGGTIVWPA